MSKLRRKFVTVLAVLFCAMLALSTAFLIPNKTVNAAYSASNFNIIGNGNDFYLEDAINGKVFNGNLLDELYEALTGEENATYETLKSKLNSSSSKDDNGKRCLTSADIRAVQYSLGNTVGNNGQNISIWLGGFKWDVTFITTDINDNIIVDLWQSADNNLGSSKFAEYADRSTDGLYASDMYSTSYMRIKTLNAGGYYATNKNTLVTNIVQQDSTNKYAHLTMADPANGHESLIDFIVKPTDVAYQANEKGIGHYKSGDGLMYLAINEAYNVYSGADLQDSKWRITGYDIREIMYKGSEEDGTAYGYWKNDYLWLPSFAETAMLTIRVTVFGKRILL